MTAAAPDARLARLAGISDLRERVARCRLALEQVRDEAVQARRLRDALIYAGTDRFGRSSAPAVCRVVEDPPPDQVAVACPLPHKSMGLCVRHYQMWKRMGRRWDLPWADGGLGLDSAPYPPNTARGWRARAIRISGISSTAFAEVTRLRVTDLTGLQQLAEQPGDGAEPGYYAYQSPTVRAVLRLPDPPTYPGEDEHWRAAGAAHRAVKAAGVLDERIQHDIRNPALWALMRTGASSTTLAALAGLGDQWVYELRRMLRQGTAA